MQWEVLPHAAQGVRPAAPERRAGWPRIYSRAAAGEGNHQRTQLAQPRMWAPLPTCIRPQPRPRKCTYASQAVTMIGACHGLKGSRTVPPGTCVYAAERVRTGQYGLDACYTRIHCCRDGSAGAQRQSVATGAALQTAAKVNNAAPTHVKGG